MQYHLRGRSGEEDTEEAPLQPVTTRVQKHDYQIAVFGGSEATSCQYFDPKGIKTKQWASQYNLCITHTP